MHVLAVCLEILAGWFMLSITTAGLVCAAMYYGNSRSANAPSAKVQKSPTILALYEVRRFILELDTELHDVTANQTAQFVRFGVEEKCVNFSPR